MPSMGKNDNISNKPAYFLFIIKDISLKDFKENYEIEYAELNGKQIDNKEIYYDEYLGFRFDSINYNFDNNNIQLILKNKKNNKKYLKECLNYKLNITM